jgi:predicted N-acyltransferase
VKTHSAGEFVFDYAWAEVAEQLHAEYYPKLVAMSPLTPAIGYRFLIDSTESAEDLVGEMIAEIHAFCAANDLHSFSVLWPEPDFAAILGEDDFTPWRHQHFRWENESFSTFDDYLAVFNKNQRRNIRRERASMTDQGLEIRTSFASDVPENHFDAMYRYYLNTNDQFGMWAARYLTEDFFHMIREASGDRVVFSCAYEGHSDAPVGMSMLLYKPDRLIGRYWGAERFVNNLHFNLCYYEPIRWGIEHGVQRFDPGMGSSHKVRRGFRAVATHSLHHFYDERMQMVMKMNIDKINRYEQSHIEHLNDHLPFAQGR